MSTNTTLKQDWYPNGQLKEYALYEGNQLANGWSFKLYHPNGILQQQQCYSHGQLIEQQTFDENGNKVAHTIWNQRLQQMVDRPVVTPAKQTQRPNIASGCMTIDSIAEIMPVIAELIESPDLSDEMLKAHDRYYGYSSNESEEDEEKWEYNKENEEWSVKGHKGWFSVIFEHHEGYLFYHIHTPNINDYERARQLVDHAQNRYRLQRYFTEEELTKRAKETGRSILYYIAPYNSRTCLETELTTWGTEAIYNLLEKNYILSVHRIDTTSEQGPRETSFLAALPNWEAIISEVKQNGDMFYIAQHRPGGSIPILKSPTILELEAFLRENS